MDGLLSAEVRQALLGYPGLHLIPPAGFLDTIALESNARLVLTDSGRGGRSKNLFRRAPLCVLRPETEWVELVERGQAVLADAEPERIRDAADRFLRDGAPLSSALRRWPAPLKTSALDSSFPAIRSALEYASSFAVALSHRLVPCLGPGAWRRSPTSSMSGSVDRQRRDSITCAAVRTTVPMPGVRVSSGERAWCVLSGDHGVYHPHVHPPPISWRGLN